jgi:hypothetical protein
LVPLSNTLTPLLNPGVDERIICLCIIEAELTSKSVINTASFTDNLNQSCSLKFHLLLCIHEVYKSIENEKKWKG